MLLVDDNTYYQVMNWTYFWSAKSTFSNELIILNIKCIIITIWDWVN